MPLATDNTQQTLPAKEVFKIYAKHLESNSWCINASGKFIMAFQASSNEEANLEYFAITFDSWSKQVGIRVQTDEYLGFTDNLSRKLTRKLPCILGSTMRPTPQQFIIVNGATYANTYAGFSPPRPADCAVPLVEKLFERLFPDEAERKWCKQFIAHIVQKPLERPQHGLLITGAGATCKSSLMRVLSLALGGRHFYSKNDYTQALQKFSEVLPDNLAVVFDDATATKDTYEDLKDTVTRDWQTVERKSTQKYVRREVFARIVVISNKPRPLRLVDDRRFFAPAFCEHLVSEENSAEFGAELSASLLDSDMPAKLYHWLMDTDLKGFTVGSCPRTETLIQMEGASTPALERHISVFIEDKTSDDGIKPIFHEKEISAYLFAAGLTGVSQDSIGHKLIAQGYEQKRRTLTKDEKDKDDKQKQIYLWSPICKRARSLTVDEEKLIKSFINPSF